MLATCPRLLQILLPSLLMFGLALSAQAEPRAPMSRMDTFGQSGAASIDASGKAAAAAQTKPDGKATQKQAGDCCGGRRCDAGKCAAHCNGGVRAGYFGSLFDLFDGKPHCPRGDMADSQDDAEMPATDRPPRLI